MKSNFTLVFAFLFSYSFAQLNCYEEQTNLYQYYASIENIADVPSDFDKSDFVEYLTDYGNLSSEDLSTLNTDIVTLFKSFPSAQSPILKKVVSIDATSDIYPILNNANNSVTGFECRENGYLLHVENPNINSNTVSVYPNPISESSVLKVNSEIKSFELKIVNTNGQLLFDKVYQNNIPVNLSKMILLKGYYVLIVKDLNTNKLYSTKILK